MTQSEEMQLGKTLDNALSMAADVAKVAIVIKEKIMPVASSSSSPQPPYGNYLLGQASHLVSSLQDTLNLLEWANRQL